jgi:hypothetical protein
MDSDVTIPPRSRVVHPSPPSHQAAYLGMSMTALWFAWA